MKNHRIAALLSFVAGFVDTAGFLGLQGLFTAHVTGNFVTLGAALVLGTHGVVAKLLALPEFILVVALARLAGAALAARRWPTVRFLLTAKVGLLIVFFVLAVSLWGRSLTAMRRRRWRPALPASPPWRFRMPSSAFISAASRRVR